MNGEDDDPFQVAETHPSLPGHFPGRPVVPGVLILDLIVEGWRRRMPGARIGGLRKMKFLNPLPPGRRFQVIWSEVRDGKVSFKAEMDDLTLASGQFVVD